MVTAMTALVDDDNASVAEAVEEILCALGIIAAMARDEDKYAEVAAEKIAMGQIKGLAELILSFIDARKPAKTKVWRVQ